MCQEGDNTLCWYLPTEYTDDLYPPYAGAGNHIKFRFGSHPCEWLCDSGNLELW